MGNIKIKRITKGFYEVGKFHLVEKNDNGPGWKVMRFPTESSNEPSETYDFDYYREAKNHAIMEANILSLCSNQQGEL